MASSPPPRRAGPTTVLPRRAMTAQSMTAIRRQFLSQGLVPEDVVPAPILRSWQRCAALGLHMDERPRIEPIDGSRLRERHDRAARLRSAARTEIRVLHEEAAASGAVVILTDADGFVLDMLGHADFAAKAARVALRPGVLWGEAATGTNAIGAALAERAEISVLGAEHFFESHRILSCTAAPIVGPCGEAVGVLDLSNHAEVQPTHAPALVRRAVAAIEHRLFAETFGNREMLAIHLDPGELGSAREGLLAFEGDRLIGATRRALSFLEIEVDALGRLSWGELFASGRIRAAGEARIISARGRPLFGLMRRPAEPFRSSAASRSPTGAVDPPATRPRPRSEATTIWDDQRARALARATRLVDADVPVLVQGETGTGKEVFARALHAASARADRPFVAVNCAALPEGLIEAELFGYEEGAFTGARRKGSKGLLREADGGVLFLDEIGDMPLALQARLLRALQEREVTPLGGGRPVAVDFVLVCATHHGLADAVEARCFRQDLYFRIAQYTVELPPLRERSDLAGVIERMWTEMAGANQVALSPAAFDRLAGYEWPGNFRQLAATLRTLAILAEPGETLDEEALPADIRCAPRRIGSFAADGGEVAGESRATIAADEPRRLDDMNRAAMRAALDACGGNVTRAAARLGVHRSTFYRRLFEGLK
ncbi:MAG: sigma-54-dependent Fis family transcriptional regulator [Siculibacillus sp.]|nr:sigma-54-dependent Fis family transcriptional regulator [Siculibacillus sp.]